MSRILAIDQSTERLGFCLMDADGSIVAVERTWLGRNPADGFGRHNARA